jgi:alkanesulfonate monooxygenase SsuD/methylene tetrahydromethanopterin reductase-like flavin-dependent oxidoreductase (luciferase family)
MESGSRMSFGLVIRPQHHPWERMAAEWPAAEEMGFESIWTNDHFYGILGPADGASFEANTTLAAIALSTKKVRFGAMTYAITHRHPAVLYKQLVTLDHMSGGRVICGIGAGWDEPEHNMVSAPFPTAGERVSRLEEALRLFRRLESEERTTFEGNYYPTVDTPFQPKPVNGRIPFLIGGTKPRMLGIVGRYADIWDSSMKPDEWTAAFDVVKEHAKAAGRDPNEIIGSTGVWGPNSAWNPDANDADFAANVRAAYKAGARQLLVKYPWDRAAVDKVPDLMSRVVPELRAELER